jgi:hypothetical protein
VAELDALARQRDCFQPARANFVNRRRLGFIGESGADRDLSRRCLTESCWEDIAKIDFLNGGRRNIGGGESTLGSDDTELDGA